MAGRYTRGAYDSSGLAGLSRAARWIGVVALLVGGLAATWPGERSSVERAVSAQMPFEAPTAVAQLGGYLGPIAGDGDRLYVTVGSRVRILDATRHPIGPALGETPPLTQSVIALAARGDWLFVATRWSAVGALWAIEVADPRAPRVAAVLPLDGIPESLVLEEGGGAGGGEDLAVAWLKLGRRGLWAVDLADPERPQIVGPWRSEDLVARLAAGRGRAVALVWPGRGDGTATPPPADASGHLVVLAVEGGAVVEKERVTTGIGFLQAFDLEGSWGVVSSGLGPYEIKAIHVPEEGPPEIATRSTDLPLMRAARVDGDVAWLLDDVGRLHRVALIGPAETWSSEELLLGRALARLATAGGRLWAADILRLAVADLAPPVSIMGEIDPGSRFFRDVVAVPGGMRALTDEEMVAVTSIGRPWPIVAAPLPTALVPGGRLAVGEGDLLVGGGGRLGWASPATAIGPDRLRTSPQILVRPPRWDALAIAQGRWLGAGMEGALTGALPVDGVWEPGKKQWIPGRAPVALRPPFAWTNGFSRLHVVDVRDPRAAAEVAQIALPALNPVGLAFVEGHLIVAGGTGRVSVLDVSDVRRPRVLAEIDLGRSVTAIQAKGHRLWVAWDDGLRPWVSLLDLSDPASPTERWSFHPFAQPLRIEQTDDHVVLLAASALTVHGLPTGLPTPRPTRTPGPTPTFWAPTPTITVPAPTVMTPFVTPRMDPADTVWLPYAHVWRAAEDEATVE